MTKEGLNEVLRLHSMWRRGEVGGQRADFSGMDLTGANMSGADLTGADLTGANMRGAKLLGADLSRANLADANLPGGVPIVPNLDAQVLAAVDGATARGHLDMDSWHGGAPIGALAALDACGTTHCRAGWAIVLAGEPGFDLERKIGPSAAGALIYHASVGYVPDFLAGNELAMADIRARAAQQTVEAACNY